MENIFISNQGLTMKIIDFVHPNKGKVIFENGYVVIAEMSNIRKGKVKNLLHPTMLNIGYIGVGKYNSCINRKMTKPYKTWASMFKRCYNYSPSGKYNSYDGCSVIPIWHNFQNFAKWFEENYIEGFHLDKDILVKGNKVYSPDNCCFVPNEINNLFRCMEFKNNNLPVGVYPYKLTNRFKAKIGIDNGKHEYIGIFETVKDAKTAYDNRKRIEIVNKAEKYKNLISEKCYLAMIR
jgi:hypothetical protein